MEVIGMQTSTDSLVYKPFDDEEFKHMPSADGLTTSILPYYLLGDVSAKIEWSKRPDKARNTFVHLNAYKHFIDEEQLLLLGRTGSGKSAIMCCLKDDIENQRISQYSDVLQIDEAKFCEKLAELCYDIDIDRFDATNKITEAIVMTINTRVMLYCFDQFKCERGELKSIIKYLLSLGLIQTNDNSFLKNLDNLTSDQLQKSFKDIGNNSLNKVLSTTKILLTVRKMFKNNEDTVIEENGDYLNALNELGAFLSERNKKILVLLDSFDEYKINDKAFVVAVKSLINACFNIYSISSSNRVYFKMAIASEVYTRVLTHLPAQRHTNTVAIIWSYKELMICMALRFVSWYHDLEGKHSDKHYLFSFLNDYSISDLKNSNTAYKTTEDIFYHILPRICKTNSSYTYLTLAFISRHTMKKPREILQIFNAILDIIICENDSQYFLNDNSDIKIKDVVHSLQNDFISQNLSLYRNFIPNIDKYVDKLLYGRNFIFFFSDEDFNNKLKEVNALIQSERSENEYLSYFDKSDVLNVIFETGLLGQVSKVNIVNTKNKFKQFGTDKSIKIINALFEYQFKGNLQKSRDKQYVIHPMCYEHFSCLVGMRSMVNTDSYDKTELLSSILSEE